MDNISFLKTDSIFRSVNGQPAENMRKVIELMGGIESFINKNDIVIIKPNAQWWSHGATNLSAIYTLVDIIMNQTGFMGEVILGENCHRGHQPWLSSRSAWAATFRNNIDMNGIQNLNDLTNILKQKYKDRFTISHWIDVDSGGRQIYSPYQESGYVYCDGKSGNPLITCSNDNGVKNQKRTIMTYPIFQTDKGTIVDFKNGVFNNGSYSSNGLKWINFSALNHHSRTFGATAAIKNIFGVVDLSKSNYKSDETRNSIYVNFHNFAALHKNQSASHQGLLGRAVGTFMKTIRHPDLNIISAEWLGLSSRVHFPISHTRAILASRDPVALDYHAFKYLLYPNSKIKYHNPDKPTNAIYFDLNECAQQIGSHCYQRRNSCSYDYKSQSTQKDNQLIIKGKIKLGKSVKGCIRYLIYRYGFQN
jgi:uncharacterized protein (DUF362 family)